MSYHHISDIVYGVGKEWGELPPTGLLIHINFGDDDQQDYMGMCYANRLSPKRRTSTCMDHIYSGVKIVIEDTLKSAYWSLQRTDSGPGVLHEGLNRF